MEITSAQELERFVAAGARSWEGVRLQGVDLTRHEHVFDREEDLRGLVVLGGNLPADLARRLTERGAVVFPTLPDAPVDVYRGTLYTADDLYAGLAESGYATTPDAVAYEWTRQRDQLRDAYVAVMQALHDTSMHDALDELLDGRRVVGVMGGHAVARGSDDYARAARLGHRLAQAGVIVLTGGGPGAMEAANLGARCTDARAVDAALTDLAAVPSFAPDIDAWARLAFDVLERMPVAGVVRSVGIPTWFYGHEPPNVFADHIAKFFSNALREDGLLAEAREGIIVLPGAAGTVQEIFQAVTPRYYTATGITPPPLVLVGEHHWTAEVPAWPLVQALARDRAMAQSVHLVDSLEEAAATLGF